MYNITTVTTKDELLQIHELNQKNLKQNLTVQEQNEEGFVTWLYSVALLEQMHQLAPGIIVKEEEQVVGYALTTLKEAGAFHPDLQIMFQHLEQVSYNGTLLFSCRFYCMGQICIAKGHRGKGLIKSLYEKHKEVYSPHYEFILTEISTGNLRSQKAHKKIGFTTIHTYRDATDEWNVVVWDWR